MTALSNGNYVIDSPFWSNKGAVTLMSGSTGKALADGSIGSVSASNSLVGGASGDLVGKNGVTALSNGNYVVASPDWSGYKGAVTLVSGSTGLPVIGASAVVSAANSLVGDAANDLVGGYGVTVLSNGNYIVACPAWSGKTGAVTLMSGVTGKALADGSIGPISASNSLVGSNSGDDVGAGVVTLSDGNCVIDSPGWNGGMGAVTLVSGNTGKALVNGSIGPVSASNSIVGGAFGDQVGGSGVTALNNGNYVIDSPFWSGGTGAVTLVNGGTGKALADGSLGPVSAGNSLVGSTSGDQVGGGGLTALGNGSYVVDSPYWSGNTGAATLVNGGTGFPFGGASSVTAGNSLIGDNSNAGLSSIVQDTVNQTYLAGFTTDGSNGAIKVGFLNANFTPNQLTYALFQGQSIGVTPSFLTQTLATGAAVVLQASNDLTVSAPISVSAGGRGGSLTLEAGRSILLNAGIATDNGSLTLIANDTLAHGVIDADRAHRGRRHRHGSRRQHQYRRGQRHHRLARRHRQDKHDQRGRHPASRRRGRRDREQRGIDPRQRHRPLRPDQHRRGTITMTAHGNLTAAGNATISSGTGTILLGDDLNADQSGDDGVGTLNIAAGAMVTSANSTAGAITLRGADMNIQGPIAAGSGGVVIRPSLESRPMSIGGSDTAVDGVNLTDAELAHISTAATGTVTFGDANQTGNLTFVTATTATIPGAATVVLQSSSGPGAIVLDEQFQSRAVNGNGGSVSLTAGTSGICVINAARGVHEVVTTTASSNQTAVEGASTAFSLGSFADVGTNDGPWTVSVNWGDNTPSATFAATTQGRLPSRRTPTQPARTRPV